MWLPYDDKTYKALEELKTASDRSLAILAGTIIDSQISEFLNLVLGKDGSDYNRKVRAQLFGYDGALGAFGPRISLAHLLGIFSEDAHSDLQNLKNIRNLFAHYSEHNSFESQKLKALCANFKLVDSRVSGPVRYMPGGDKEKSFEVGAFVIDDRGQFKMHSVEKDLIQGTARGRFTGTAQVFCAALGSVLRDCKDGSESKGPHIGFPIL